ncbi:hypothetical protein B0H13DRAFT_2302226 [Mycena leptocephala]|nr:hypothetical protein B0H13DRAFT_2302226 [Mycena leptocephala]
MDCAYGAEVSRIQPAAAGTTTASARIRRARIVRIRLGAQARRWLSVRSAAAHLPLAESPSTPPTAPYHLRRLIIHASPSVSIFTSRPTHPPPSRERASTPAHAWRGTICPPSKEGIGVMGA